MSKRPSESRLFLYTVCKPASHLLYSLQVLIGWLFFTNHVSGASTLILELPDGDGCADQYPCKHHSRSVQPLAAVLQARHSLTPHFFLHSLAAILSWCRAFLLFRLDTELIKYLRSPFIHTKLKTWVCLKYICTQGRWNHLCWLFWYMKYETRGTFFCRLNNANEKNTNPFQFLAATNKRRNMNQHTLFDFCWSTPPPMSWGLVCHVEIHHHLHLRAQSRAPLQSSRAWAVT